MQEGAEWKMFSPLHSQMHSEFGNPYLYNIGNDQGDPGFQYGSNLTELDAFLDSVLGHPVEQSSGGMQALSSVESPKSINTRQCVKDSNSTYESDADMSQVLVNAAASA